FDADLECNSSNDAYKGWLHDCVFAQVSVREVYSLQDCLVKAVCLDGELKYYQDSFFSDLGSYPALMEVE
ncbi:MAG: hypothetical protein ACK55I_11630, partial [bacterium]